MAILFSFPENDILGKSLEDKTSCESGIYALRHFPDGETFLRIDTEVEGKDVLILCSLDRPDEKVLPLIFFSETLKELGAKSVGLIAPYLGYMRQDKRFHKGEAVTADIFAELLSQYFDSLITIDPHLHRHKAMKEIYNIPTQTVHAADAVAEWIKNNIEKPVLIGPDEESHQWVSDVAKKAKVPYTVLTKIRQGDRSVKVSVPEVNKYNGYTPVLVDDIISTARTMIETVKHLKDAKMNAPVCIGVHAVFAGEACEDLESEGAARIITCNTISHPTNAIDVSSLIAEFLQD